MENLHSAYFVFDKNKGIITRLLDDERLEPHEVAVVNLYVLWKSNYFNKNYFFLWMSRYQDTCLEKGVNYFVDKNYESEHFKRNYRHWVTLDLAAIITGMFKTPKGISQGQQIIKDIIERPETLRHLLK